MRYLTLEKKDWLPDELHRHFAPASDGIDDDVTVIDAATGKPVLVQLTPENISQEDLRLLSRMLRYEVTWHIPKSSTTTARLSGIGVTSRTFGTTAPVPLRRRFACSRSSFDVEHPECYTLLENMASKFFPYIEQYYPEKADHHIELMQDVHKDWWIGDAPWTSGVINHTSILPYHLDRSNIKGTWSAMLCVRNRVNGGALHFPEYDITLGIPDGSLVLFDGQALWHGVTPLVYTTKEAYRYTIVLYSKAGIRRCGCAADEPFRAASRATEVQGRGKYVEDESE